MDFAPYVLSMFPTLETLDLRFTVLPRSNLRSVSEASPPSLRTLILKSGFDHERRIDELPPVLDRCRKRSYLSLRGMQPDGDRLLDMLKRRQKREDLDPIKVLRLDATEPEDEPVRAELIKLVLGSNPSDEQDGFR